ncbi:two-component regulator propeller domain-containing protein [Plebeiibacterium sediminum]|uniref:histidine kinase n=1 Tax=Plebeiibacterium sediminum TaxID=2992112 RepID=A0AAE3SHQ8_9BACT|nr:two-component regulator propeller domain-containing protein [Plebeiobacterium sediminum]MCW3789512.1 helix-turn-helix domain-containing protein [Plebeiobacterium sediminum]
MSFGCKSFIIIIITFLFVHKVSANNLFFEKIEGITTVPNTSIHGIVKDSIGYIWFGTENGLYRFNGLDFERYANQETDSISIPGNRIRNIVLDQEDQVWLLDFDNHYFKYNYSDNIFAHIKEDEVHENLKERLSFDANRLNYNKIINDNRFYLSNHHFTAFNIRTKQSNTYLSNFDKPGCLSEDYITSFYIDNHDFIWIGTREGTIYKVNLNRKPFDYNLNFVPLKEKSIQTSVRTILKTDEALWLASNHEGISIYKDGKLQNEHPYYKLSDNQKQVRSLLEDKNGNIWIGGVSGLEKFDSNQQIKIQVINKNIKPEFDRWSVYSMAQADSDYIWVGLFNKLAKINIHTNRTSYLYLEELIGKHSITAIKEDVKGNVWLGTEGSGLIYLKRNSNKEIVDTIVISDTIVKGNRVYSLYEDERGMIWVGTSEGLSAVDPNNINRKDIYPKDLKKACFVCAITGDNNGNIWVSHKSGLFKIELENKYVTSYNLGTKTSEWVFQNGAVFNDHNNQLYFGAREGYVKFRADSIQKDSSIPKLFLSALHIAGTKVEPQGHIEGNTILSKALFKTEEIQLPYKNRSFSIEMIALYYQNPIGVKYYYMLEGIDDIWQETKENMANYKKIPSGSYVFKVKALSPDGIWSDEKRLKILISSPWYASIQAIIIYIVVGLIILYLVYLEIKARQQLKNKILVERLNAEKLEEINKEKLEFFTNVSHELRTPLTLISDPVKQLKSPDISTEKKQLYIDIIDRNVNQLSQLINQILDFRKTEAGKIKLNYEEKDGIKIIYDAVKSFDIMANQRKIKLNFSTALPAYVGLFDEDKLQKIILNILSNSFKYTPDRGVINVILKHEDQHLIIKIEDTGIGITKNKLHKIFEPFNSIGSKPFQGSTSGMGLALTKNWIQQLNGTIAIESNPDKGTIVTINLPVISEDEQVQSGIIAKSKECEQSEESQEVEEESKIVILVVEDNLDIQEYLNQELKDDYLILKAKDGLEGLNMALNHIPDLIISDVMMPEMDGIEMCSKIKNDEKTCHIPVVMLTAKTSNNAQVDGLKTGADVYIPKPFSIDVLKAQIESIFKNRQRLQDKLAERKFASELNTSENPIDHAFLNKTSKLIEENLSVVGFKQEQLAQSLRISTRQLSRKIKAITGNTVHEYITKVRMEKASELLLESNLNITEIAFQLGFSEQSNFSRSFSKYFGCSPSKYKG